MHQLARRVKNPPYGSSLYVQVLVCIMARTNKIIIDLGSIDSRQALHEALSAALAFPGWYGNNWDAFWDAITGLVEMPEKLHFSGWTAFEARLPDQARHLHVALKEMSEKYPESASEVSYG